MTMAVGTLNIIAQATVNVTGVAAALPTPLDASGNPLRARHALISVEGGAIRWGFQPNASTGIYVGAGGTIDWTDANNDYWGLVKNAQFVLASGTPVLQVQFMG